jgi:phage replication-related protein YjqB (UPF0714/DUF867 family)
MFDELLRQPGVRETVVLRSTFGFMAFHGGLEGGTETIAEAAAAGADASLYAVVQPPELVWHIPSALVSPGHSTALARFLDHVDVVVAVHGYGRRGRAADVLLGGGNRVLAGVLAGSLRAHLPDFAVFDDFDAIPVELRGLHPDNPVNRARRGGVQIELPPLARGASPSPSRRGEPCTPVPGVVHALVDTALAWAGDGRTRTAPPPAADHPVSKVPPTRQ